MKKLILILTVVSGLFSCSKKEVTTTETCGESKEISFNELSSLYRYTIKGKDFTTVIVNTREKFETLFVSLAFSQRSLPPTPITPDFSKLTLLGVVVAEKGLQSYEVKIANVVENNCNIVVSYYEHELIDNVKPLPIDVVKENPSHFILIPKNQKPIVYKRIDFIPKNQILGTWSWYQTTGGIAGVDETPINTNQTRSVVFTQSGNIIFYTNGKETANHKYEIKKGVSILDNKEHDILVYANMNHVVYLPSNKFGPLIIVDDVVDGFASKYNRSTLNF
jgi:hypothetical protein